MKDSQLQKKKKRLFKKKSNPDTVTVSRQTNLANQNIKDTKPTKRSRFGGFKKIKSLGRSASVNQVVRKNENLLLLILIPFILLTIYFTIYYLNTHISENIKANELTNSQSQKIFNLPVIVNSYTPYISAKAAIAVNAENQSVIFSKNSKIRFSMASTAKIMTALVALDHFHPDSILEVKSKGIEGSIIGLQPGEKFYFDELLYAMLLPSANDAAVAIVDNYPGGRTAFVAKMNEKAKELYLDNTLFSDPTGLDDDGNFTTVDDLARLGSQAMQYEEFSKVVGTYNKTITNQRKSKIYSLTNLNRLLGVNGVNGIKTGTTEGAGEVLVTSSVIGDHTYIIVVMNSLDRFADTNTLMDFITDNVSYVDLSNALKSTNIQ